MGLLSLNLPVIGQSSATEDQKIRDGLTSIQTVMNGNVDEANVPNLAAAFTTYKRLHRFSCAQTPAGAAATYLMSAAAAVQNISVVGGGATTFNFVIELDPADFNANARATKLRLRLTALTNAVAPAITFTAGLYPIATYGGAVGVDPTIASLGTVVSGSTAAVASPPAGGRTTQAGTDFNCPAAGAYAVGLVTSGTPAASSLTHLVAFLEMRQT